MVPLTQGLGYHHLRQIASFMMSSDWMPFSNQGWLSLPIGCTSVLTWSLVTLQLLPSLSVDRLILLRIDGVTLLKHMVTSPSYSECFRQAAGGSWKCHSLSPCGPGVLSFTVTDKFLFLCLGPVKKARKEIGGCCCTGCHWSRGLPVDLRFLQATWPWARVWPQRIWGRGAVPVPCCSLWSAHPHSAHQRLGAVVLYSQSSGKEWHELQHPSFQIWKCLTCQVSWGIRLVLRSIPEK